MVYRNVSDFSSGDVLRAAQLNNVLDNIDENKDRIVSPGKGQSKSTNVSKTTSTSYQGSPIFSITRTFHGRPVLLLLGGMYAVLADDTYKVIGGHNIGYKIDSGSIVSLFQESSINLGTTYVASRYFHWNAPAYHLITNISAGQHTIGFYSKKRVSYGDFAWVHPGAFIMELPFDNMN